MTDFFVAYLSLGLAIIMLVIALWSRLMWIYYVSAAGWIFCGAYAMAVASTSGEIYVQIFGLFCILAGIGTIGAIWMRPKNVERPIERYNHTKAIGDLIEHYRTARRGYKKY